MQPHEATELCLCLPQSTSDISGKMAGLGFLGPRKGQKPYDRAGPAFGEGSLSQFVLQSKIRYF
jgi:hypothetical protein